MNGGVEMKIWVDVVFWCSFSAVITLIVASLIVDWKNYWDSTKDDRIIAWINKQRSVMK